MQHETIVREQSTPDEGSLLGLKRHELTWPGRRGSEIPLFLVGFYQERPQVESA